MENKTKGYKGISPSSLKPTKKVSAVILDWDATLATSLEATLKALQETFKLMDEIGYPVNIPWLENGKTFDDVTVEELVQHKHVRSRLFLKELYTDYYKASDPEKGEKAAKFAKEIFDMAREPIRENAILLDGAFESLKELLDRVKHVTIVSDKDKATLETQVKLLLGDKFKIGFEENFNSSIHDILVVGGVKGRKEKPHGDKFLDALDKMRVRPNDGKIWVVGDRIIDIGAAIDISNKYDVKPILFSSRYVGIIKKEEKVIAGDKEVGIKPEDIGMVMDHEEFQKMIKTELPQQKNLAR